MNALMLLSTPVLRVSSPRPTTPSGRGVRPEGVTHPSQAQTLLTQKQAQLGWRGSSGLQLKERQGSHPIPPASGDKQSSESTQHNTGEDRCKEKTWQSHMSPSQGPSDLSRNAGKEPDARKD